MAQDPSALLTLLDVFWVNLLLSSDNAILIALACRNLPPGKRRLGMVLGAATAIGLRLFFSALAIPVLSLAGLKLTGAILLVWIASSLMLGSSEDNTSTISGHDRLWHAVRAIAVADIILSLDNVLVIVGIAHDTPIFLGLGLLMSVPLIVWGADAIGAWIERYPPLAFIGAGLIGWSAGQLAYSDPWTPEVLISRLGENGEQWAAAFGATLVVLGGLSRRQWHLKRRGLSESSSAS
jgi:YjbE family integral membrane protein